MSSWVRYCVTVYVGLLFSGAVARPPWTRQPPSDQPPPARLEAESARALHQTAPDPVIGEPSDTLDG